MIPESFIEEVLSRTDIVQVIGRYVKLQHKGSNWMACCPFHKEKTPSFAVNPSKQFFKCFGCGEHGTAITFLMKFKGLSFPEAIKELADDLGMEVPEDRMAKARQAKAKTLTDYLAQAADFYHQTLFHDRKAIEYLNKAKAGQNKDATAAANFILSKCYRFGRGVPTDINQADKLLEESQKGGWESTRSINQLIPVMRIEITQ